MQRACLITGCSSRLGRIARAALRRGDRVAVTARTGFYGERLMGSNQEIPDYDMLADQYWKKKVVNHCNQPGNLDKGGEIIAEPVFLAFRRRYRQDCRNRMEKPPS